MENRIKEQQLDLFADRTSTATMHANQLRLYFASFAYVLMQTLRRVGLAGTRLAKAQCGTIRDKLLKVGVRVRVSVRRIKLSFSESWPRAVHCSDRSCTTSRPCHCVVDATLGSPTFRRHWHLASGCTCPATLAVPRSAPQ